MAQVNFTMKDFSISMDFAQSKADKIIKLLISFAEDIKPLEMTTWYHVVEYPENKEAFCWGFAIKDDIVVQAPYGYTCFIHKDLFKSIYFTKDKNIKVIKVGEVCY